MAQARLEKRAKHLHFLSAELSFFELFNVNTATSSIESRRQLAKVLAELLPQWNPGNFLTTHTLFLMKISVPMKPPLPGMAAARTTGLEGRTCLLQALQICA